MLPDDNNMPPKSNAAADVPTLPAANLLELFHARQLRDSLAQQVVRLEEQSCLVGWGFGMAEFEPLYCDSEVIWCLL